jgi:Predicted membrane protein
MDLVLVGVVIAITSSFLLVLRRELHQFAHRLSHNEVRGAAEFAIIAFVVYPLLPPGTYGPWDAIDPQLIWTLVIAVSGIGFANYAIMQRYGGRGMLITGFFGGLVNSTAVIGEIANRAKANDGILTLAVATVLVADAAMAVRNLVIVVAFVPESALSVGLPLGLIAVGGLGITVYERNWGGDIELDLDSPFSSRNALTFGALFLAVLVATAAAQQMFGDCGLFDHEFLQRAALQRNHHNHGGLAHEYRPDHARSRRTGGLGRHSREHYGQDLARRWYQSEPARSGCDPVCGPLSTRCRRCLRGAVDMRWAEVRSPN